MRLSPELLVVCGASLDGMRCADQFGVAVVSVKSLAAAPRQGTGRDAPIRLEGVTPWDQFSSYLIRIFCGASIGVLHPVVPEGIPQLLVHPGSPVGHYPSELVMALIPARS